MRGKINFVKKILINVTPNGVRLNMYNFSKLSKNYYTNCDSFKI